MNPLTWLVVTNTASDPDLPANALSYSLVNPPDGADIDTNGVITWFPYESQAPATYTFTTIVIDYNPDAVNTQRFSATNSFQVSVSETRRLLPLVIASDGGAVDLSPPGGRYPSNTVVQLTPRSTNGWTFLGWRGDLDGDNPTANITMNRRKSVRALFGTSLDTHVSGDGIVMLYPTNSLWPYGSIAQLVAIPGSNSFLSIWNFSTGTNTMTTTVNPLRYSVVDPMVSFEAVFAPLEEGQVTLTPIPDGRGQILIDPQANHYTVGALVHLVAVPEAGQRFMGWTGDETNATLSLDVTLDRSKIITAHFSKRPRLQSTVSDRSPDEAFRLALTGDPGVDYAIQSSEDLQTWTEVAVVNSPFGSAQISDPASTNIAHRSYRAISPPGYVAPPPTPFISTGSVWKYLDNGSDQGANWIGNGFDDSSWASGPAQLGYGDGDEATVVSFGPNEGNKYITTYFRRTFNVTNALSFGALRLRLLRDDGAIVYLNGHEVFRSNMPPGPILYSTLASSGVGGGAESTFYPAMLDPSFLVNGSNVLAVEIHQVSPESSDISFDLELIGQSE